MGGGGFHGRLVSSPRIRKGENPNHEAGASWFFVGTPCMLGS
jgi:hypothetical protein